MMNRAKDRQAKNERGFTLVEVLIVAIIFSGIIISLSVLFLNGTTLQARALNKQLVFDDAAFIMERIVRDIVPSQIISADTGGACIDASLTDTLDLNSWVEGHLHYYAYVDDKGNKKIERQVGDTGGMDTYTQEMTSNRVKMTNLKWCIMHPPSMAGQARVTLIGTFTSINQLPVVNLRIQTTATQRIFGVYTPTLGSL